MIPEADSDLEEEISHNFEKIDEHTENIRNGIEHTERVVPTGAVFLEDP